MISATVIGNVGQQPEARPLDGGGFLLTFSVASNSRAKVGGQWQDVTTWVRVAMFGARAEQLAKVLERGSSVWVYGEMWIEEYEGQKQVKLKAADAGFAGQKREGGQGQQRQAQPSREEAPRGNGGGYSRSGGGGYGRSAPAQRPADEHEMADETGGYGEGRNGDDLPF